MLMKRVKHILPCDEMEKNLTHHRNAFLLSGKFFLRLAAIPYLKLSGKGSQVPLFLNIGIRQLLLCLDN
jgi:hypothetical protein